MNSSTFENIQNFRVALNNACLERTGIIDGLLASIISKQNAFLLGAPGTGKSDLVRKITEGIVGAKYFGYLLSPTSDPSELFGPVKITKLMEDEYSRDTEGYLPSAHVAFLDELFRGNSAVLNSLLTILNERQYHNGKETIQTPLQSIVAATNSWPEEESLQAFSDRFLFRPTVNFLKKPASRNLLDAWSLGLQERPEVGAQMTLADLFHLQNEAKNIPCSDDFLEKFSGIWDHLATRNITVSDRRRVQILRFLQAYALVQGDDTLMPEHCHNTLVHIAYTTEDDQEVIREVIEQEVPSADRTLAVAKRAASAVMSEFQGLINSTRAMPAGSGLAGLNDLVMKLTTKLKEMQALEVKVGEILEGRAGMRVTLATRERGMKLARQIESNNETIARAVAELRQD